MAEDKRRWPLAFAEMVADMMVGYFGPRCHRIQVAGSIRRWKLDVGDIELVCIPQVVPLKNVLGEATGELDCLGLEILDLLASGLLDYRVNKDGHRIGLGASNKFLVHVPSGIPVDVFTATERNWGMTLFVRTGPAEWNVRAMSRLRQLGMRGHAYGGITDADGNEVDCPDEETVFRLLRWPYRPPSERK